MTENTTETKTCCACKTLKPIDAFGKDKRRKDGHEPRCKECRSARHAETYVKKGYATEQPKRRKYVEGWQSPNGQLFLVRRIVGDPARAWFECACGGVSKVLHIRNVASGVTQNCAERDWHKDPRMKTEAPGHKLAHAHVAKVAGKAKGRTCVDTGRQAQELSYRGWCPEELTEPLSSDYAPGSPYCLHPEHYHPRTVTAHRQYDGIMRKLYGAKQGNELLLAAASLILSDADAVKSNDAEGVAA